MSRDAKMAEGRQLLEAGDKCLKTSVFKWSPDFDGAASNYDKAGTCFKIAKDLERCIEAFVKAADMHEKLNNRFHAAKALENAASAAKDGKKPDQAARLFQRSCLLYRKNGTADAASIVLEKGGACADQAGDVELAFELYLEAVDLWESEEKPHMMKAPLQKAIALAARTKKYAKLMELLVSQATVFKGQTYSNDLHMNYLARIVVQLKEGDFVAAQKVYHEALGVSGFANSDFGEVAEELITAWDNGDQEQVSKTLGKQAFSFLDADLARLARSLAPVAAVKSDRAAAAARSAANQAPAASAPAPAPVASKAHAGEDMSDLEAAMSAVSVKPGARAAEAVSAEPEEADGGLC